MRRLPRPRTAWWLERLPAPIGDVHWHVGEAWSCAGVPEARTVVDVVASTEDVAWRVLTGRMGQLMLADWSLEPDAAPLEQVDLRHGPERVLLRTWRCEADGCGEPT